MKRILTLIFILFVCLSGKAQEVEISGSRKASVRQVTCWRL